MALVRFFGRLGEQLGEARTVALPDGGCTVAELRALIGEDALAAPGVRAAIDQAIAPEDARVREGQEIAFLSPLSGG